MVKLEMDAKVIMTDSGGIQKEAFFAGIPCVTLRDETEWIETVESGWNYLAGAEHKKIIRSFHKAISSKKSKLRTFYGEGNASQIIIKKLISAPSPGSRN